MRKWNLVKFLILVTVCTLHAEPGGPRGPGNHGSEGNRHGRAPVDPAIELRLKTTALNLKSTALKNEISSMKTKFKDPSSFPFLEDYLNRLQSYFNEEDRESIEVLSKKVSELSAFCVSTPSAPADPCAGIPPKISVSDCQYPGQRTRQVINCKGTVIEQTTEACTLDPKKFSCGQCNSVLRTGGFAAQFYSSYAIFYNGVQVATSEQMIEGIGTNLCYGRQKADVRCTNIK